MLRRRRTRTSPEPEPGRASRPDGLGVEPIEVAVHDEQFDHPVDVGRWQALVTAALAAEGVRGPGEATVMFVDEPNMSQLNALHMGQAAPTDVLSFPIDGDDVISGVTHRLVGDVVVCPSVAAANAADHAGTYTDEIAVLLVHGVLHLLGHDHAEPADRDRMWARERELIAELHGPLAADPWASRS